MYGLDYWKIGEALKNAILPAASSRGARTVEQWPASAIPQAAHMLMSYPAVLVAFQRADFRLKNKARYITMFYDIWVLDQGVGQDASLDLSALFSILEAIRMGIEGRAFFPGVMAPEVMSEQPASFDPDRGLATAFATYRIRTRRLT